MKFLPPTVGFSKQPIAQQNYTSILGWKGFKIKVCEKFHKLEASL